jgi:MFS family permease
VIEGATLYLQASTAVGVVASGFLADWAVKHWAPMRFYIAGSGIVASAPFAYLAMALGSLFWVCVAAAVFGFFAGGPHGNLVSASYDVIPRENYGVGVGVLNLIGGMAGGLAIFLTGLFTGRFSISILMMGASTIAVVAGALMILAVARWFGRDRDRLTEAVTHANLVETQLF